MVTACVRATMEENIQVFFTSVVFAFRRPSCHKKRERGCQVLHVLLVKSVELSAFCLHRETCEEEESGFEEEEEEEDNEWATRSTSHHHHQPTVRSRTNEEDLPMHLYPGTKSPNNILSSFSGSPSRLCFSRAACCVCVCGRSSSHLLFCFLLLASGFCVLCFICFVMHASRSCL
jgi:hypothetical protein